MVERKTLGPLQEERVDWNEPAGCRLSDVWVVQVKQLEDVKMHEIIAEIKMIANLKIAIDNMI